MSHPGHPPRLHRADPVWLAALAAVLVGVLATALHSPLKDDVAWLLYVARKWLGGQRLYIDLVEVNPPLIIWIYAIPARLAQLTGLAPKTVALPLFALFILACTWWTSGLLHGRAALFARRIPVFVTMSLVLLLLPGVEFGQREHLLAAGILPYLALLVRGLDGEREPRAQAMAAGILAGLACALKPGYAVAFLLVEFTAALRGHRLFRTASLSAGLAILLYGVAILVFAPAFLDKAIPLALALYGATDTSTAHILSEGYRVIAGQAVMLVLCWGSAASIGRRSQFLRHLLLALAAFSIGATAVFLLQGKDWFYHRLPATIATLYALLLWLAVMLPHLRLTADRLRAGFALAAVALFAFAAVERIRPWVNTAMDPGLSTEARLERLIRHEHAHSYIAFSEWIALGFPVVNDTGVTWASRFDSMWALKGEMWRARLEGHTPRHYPIREMVAQDFIATCPDLAVMDTRKGENWVSLLIAAKPDFAWAWSHYKPIASFDGLRVLKRTGPCRPPALPRVTSTEWDGY